MKSIAFIRECDICKIVTAIDLDPTPEHWYDLCFYGQTIRTVTNEEARRLSKDLGICGCSYDNLLPSRRFTGLVDKNDQKFSKVTQ